MHRVCNPRRHIPCCVLVLLLTYAPAVQAQGQVSFYRTPTIPFGSGITADINLDGKPDLIGFDGTILLGKGDGTFTTGTKLSLTGPPLAVGDFNGDGKPDLVWMNGSSLSVLLGNGDGTFQPAINTDVGNGFSYFGVADLNSDGKADVVGVNSTAVFVFLGKGDGTFTIGAQYSAPMGTVQAVFADFNGDGNLDVAMASAGLVTVLLGKGDGTFKPPITSTGVASPFLIATGDINGDGKLDLVESDNSACQGGLQACQIYTLLGNGDGTFSAPENPVATPPVAFNVELALADLNGDGKADLVVAAQPFAQIYLSNGTGFTPGRAYYLLDEFTGAQISMIPVIADFNHDGKPDVVINQYLMQGNGDGTFQATIATLQGGSAAATGDFNQDGNPDIAVLTSSGVNVFLGDGTGAFSLHASYTLPVAPGGIPSITTVDINGDGKLDLVIPTVDPTSSTWSLTTLLGNGDGTFQTPIVSSGGSGTNPIIAIAGFNSDDKPDVAVVLGLGNNNGPGDSVYVCLGNGDGSFAPPVSYFAGVNTSSVVAADFNNDGKVDLAVSNGGLALLLGNGDGTFQPVNFVITSGLLRFLTEADFNGDGNADLTDGNNVYLGNGNGTFKIVPQLQLGGVVYLAADMNGDGKPDLLVDCFGLCLALGYGDGTFGEPIPVDMVSCKACEAGHVNFATVADFNHDHRLDIAMGINGAGIVTFLNTTATGAGPGFQVGASPFSPSTVMAGASATSTVTITPMNGFNSMVNLSCSISPTVSPAPTCTLPSSVQVTGDKAAQVQLTVATIGPMTTGTVSRPSFPLGGAPYAWTAVLLASAILFVRRRLPALATPLVFLAFFSFVGCGGGGGSSSHTTPATPSGTYTVTVTAKAGSVSSNTNSTVVVQ
jgi:VCBS repeat protein